MKKNNFFLILVMAMPFQIFAQSELFPNDTIYNRYDKYYYTNWYDECPGYRNGGMMDSCTRIMPDKMVDRQTVAIWNYTPQPLKVKGLAALIDPYCGGQGFQNPERIEEYLYLYQFDTSSFWIFPGQEREFLLVDSVRFDTAVPKKYILPRWEKDTVPESCWVYEGYFKSTVTVDSSFYIFASKNNNIVGGEGPGGFIHKPFFYVHFHPSKFDTCTHRFIEWCVLGQFHTMFRFDYEGDSVLGYPSRHGFYNAAWPEDLPGYYLPIVDQYHVDVFSADSLTGSVSGGGLIPDGWVDTMRAFPAAGYEFTHWNDGNTDNPRLITVERDSTFTAYFERTNRTYTVNLDANNTAWGSVVGGGTYPVYSQVEIRAVPAGDAFAFVGWNDGNWDNPRTVTLTQDTSFTATFQQVLAVDEADEVHHVSLMPNPASGEVKVDAGVDGRCRIEFIDMAGRLRYARNFNGPAADIDISRLTAGTWLVKVTTPTGTTIRRLVVK